MRVAIDRAGDGISLEFARLLYEAIQSGGAVAPSVRQAMVDAALLKLRPHVVAALRRAGLDVPDDVELNQDGLRQVLSDKTGLNIQSLDEAGIKAAINERVARKVSDSLGIDITADVSDPAALRDQVMGAALHAVQTGRANALMPAATIRKIRAVATWARAGVGPDDRRKYLLRWYQKKYRRTHREVWDRASNIDGRE